MKKLLLLLSLTICNLANAQYTVLADFSGNGAFTGTRPEGDQNLVSDGTFLYGITTYGAQNNFGTIFKIMPDGTGFTILHEFEGNNEGSYPKGSLVFDGTFFYGMTSEGGTSGEGIIFKIMPDGSGFTKLHDFFGYGFQISATPYGSLIYDGTYLFGMTSRGNPSDFGTIFKILPNGTGFTTLYEFAGNTDGMYPTGSLVSDGTFLYGATPRGGVNNLGTIFKIMPDGTGYIKLLDFDSASNGSLPIGSLIFDGTYLYGMTIEGGIGYGTIFKILPDGTGYVKLHEFGGGDGRDPIGSLIFDGTYLYGMTANGGINNLGTLFKILPDGTGYTKLIDFDGTSCGSIPYGSLITDGTYLYGMTSSGGSNDLGVLFKIMINGSGYLKLIDFDGAVKGSSPNGSLFSDGTFVYGLTRTGGANNDGAIFKIMINGTGYLKLFDFAGETNGLSPLGSLISDGTFLYGMTRGGGTSGFGTIFKVMPNGTGFVKLYDFSGTTNGGSPYGSLISDGTFLYGMTRVGGISGFGTIFKIMPDGTGYTKLLDFSGTANGSNPWGSLIFDGTFLYGMTRDGGANNMGTIFKIMPNGTGYAKLLDFSGLSNGSNPIGDLIYDGTFLLGMTDKGGANNKGTIFKILPNGTGYLKLFDFGSISNEANPKGALVSDGTFLYGMTVSNSGTIFKIMPNGSGYTKLLDFTSTAIGCSPRGSLFFDGTYLYGMTRYCGANNEGILFKVLPDGTGYVKMLDFSVALGRYPNGSLVSDGAYLYGMTSEGGPLGVGTVFKCGITTGITESSVETGFEIYPNPSIGIFQLEAVNLQLANSEVEVYNVMGEKIHSQKIQNDKFEIDLSNQSNGIYLVQLRTDPSTSSQRIVTKKIIINK